MSSSTSPLALMSVALSTAPVFLSMVTRRSDSMPSVAERKFVMP